MSSLAYILYLLKIRRLELYLCVKLSTNQRPIVFVLFIQKNKENCNGIRTRTVIFDIQYNFNEIVVLTKMTD